MDYKELIEALRKSALDAIAYSTDAADAIETLLAERDAAVKDLHNVSDCTSCKFYEGERFDCDTCGAFFENWQWRGPQKEGGA